MASTESLVFDLLVRDRASEGLSKVGREAEGAAKNTDELTRRLNDLSRKSVEARVKLAGDKEALAALDKMDARLITLDRRVASPNLRVEGAARAVAEISAVDVELDKLGKKGGEADKATSALSALAGSGGGAPGGMGALIGAGVALSPVVATLGVGLGGLGLAAAGVLGPIEKAAQKTGGLRANMKLLDPEQRAVATSILGLGRQYDQFQKALKPEVLGSVNAALRIGGHLLTDIQPVARATGTAFQGFLGQLDKTFQSGEFKGFFDFMARSAGPDMRMLGNLVIDLTKDLPPLLEQLQPVASGFLVLADDAAKLIGAAGKLHLILPLLGAVAGALVAGPLGALAGAAVGAGVALAVLGHHAQGAGPPVGQLGPRAYEARRSLQDAEAAAHAAGGQIQHLGGQAQGAAQHVQSLAAQVNGLTDAENKALTPLLAYSNALIAQTSDAARLNDALKKSHDRIGLKTDAERASFSAANTYIQDLLNTAAAAGKSHRGLDDVISSLRSELPHLQHAAGGTQAYWQQVQTLTGWLHRLQQIKSISEAIHVSGTGVWTVTPGKIGLPGGTAGGPFASGGLVTAGSGPRADDVLARVSRGELVVPASMVSAGFVDHLRGLLPGFASGGVVGSWPHLAGMGPWAARELRATESAIGRSVAQALIAAIRSAVTGGSGGFSGPGGRALGGDPAANRALAMRMFPWPASMWAAYDYLEMREAGYNRFARNPSSGAYGIPQALPPTKMPFAAQAAGGSHAGAQLAWMFSYIRSVYGNPASAAAHERAFSWYDSGGWLPPGATLAYNGTGRPERVGGPAVVNNITVHVNAPSGNGVQIGRAIAEYLGQFIKAGGRIYPPGTTPR